jgi:hypothetical protein
MRGTCADLDKLRTPFPFAGRRIGPKAAVDDCTSSIQQLNHIVRRPSLNCRPKPCTGSFPQLSTQRHLWNQHKVMGRRPQTQAMYPGQRDISISKGGKSTVPSQRKLKHTSNPAETTAPHRCPAPPDPSREHVTCQPSCTTFGHHNSYSDRAHLTCTSKS